MHSKEIAFLSPEDFDKFISAIPKLKIYNSSYRNQAAMTSLNFQLLFKITYYCALRITETLNLIQSDFNLEKKLLTIRESKIGKTDQTTIHPNLIFELSSFLSSHKEDDKLFKISRATAWSYAKKAGELAGLNLFKTQKQRIIKGVFTQLFKNSYKRQMIIDGANENLTSLKLRLKSETKYGGYTINDLKNWELKRLGVSFLSEEDIEKNVNWYKDQKKIYEDLSKTVKEILDKILKQNGIDFHVIENRVKKIEDFEAKIKRGVNYSPKHMQDLAGIRVICYVKSDVDKVSTILKKIFDIDSNKSRDKSQILEEDKMGYQSVHFVGQLSDSRTNLEEYHNFHDKQFEIQVRTILQHAWAEIQHDRLYKYSKNLPRGIPRRFYLVSSLLESADNEFQRLHDIEKAYSDEVKIQTSKGRLDIQIDSTSLKGYLSSKFSKVKNLYHEFGPRDNVMLECLEELDAMGIKTLQDLDNIIPDRLVKFYNESYEHRSFAGIIRAVLIIHDFRMYFRKAWKQKWNSYDTKNWEELEKFGISVNTLKNYIPGLKNKPTDH